MPEGTITRFFSDRGFGFIQPDGGGRDLYFRAERVEGFAARDVRPGLRVYYESESSPQGLRAKVVRALGAGSAGPGPVAPAGGYRFLNPYNFVRPLKAANDKAAPPLGRCMPPPHDRYVALTGRITCALTATTPLFIADADGVQGENGHYTFRFFQYGDQPAIPATSLRGSIRSVFEAATNSCFSVFSSKKRLSYHLQPEEALKLVPARVVHREDPEEWYLDLLPGTTPLAVGQRPLGLQYAAWVHRYSPLQASRTLREAPGTPYGRRKLLALTGRRHREKCQAIVEEIEHPRRGFRFWNVVKLAPIDEPELMPGPGQKRIIGYLCITNQNIENKHDERLFFAEGKPLRIPLGKVTRDRYDELLADYQDRHEDEVEKRADPKSVQGRDPAFSRFVIRRKGEQERLRSGDLVYAMLRRDGQNIGIDFIVPVSVPRVGYDQTVGERLEPDAPGKTGALLKCRDYGALCPACRTFGWVSEDASRDPGVPVAYAGRVRFSHAALTHSEGTLDATLAILSTPKPTTTRFYLRPKDGSRPRNGEEDQQVDYSEGAKRQVRGRKFYRHHGDKLSGQEYTRAGGVRDDQNRTARGVQKAGSTFSFTVDFENLAPVELGALLWALEMEGWNHRMGMGKPLGLGSTVVEVKDLQLLDTAAHYRSLDPAWQPALERKAALVKEYQDAMRTRYGRQFHDLENIRDLKALLAESPQIPVHYPRSTQEPQPEGRNYEWFMGNKRSGRDAGPRLVLRLADEDTEGLPLMDKYGKT